MTSQYGGFMCCGEYIQFVAPKIRWTPHEPFYLDHRVKGTCDQCQRRHILKCCGKTLKWRVIVEAYSTECRNCSLSWQQCSKCKCLLGGPISVVDRIPNQKGLFYHYICDQCFWYEKTVESFRLDGPQYQDAIREMQK